MAGQPSSANLGTFDAFVGHCWSAQISEGTTDRHCFTSLYGGKHIRDQHVVSKAGGPVYSGETLYSVEAGALTFIYINSLGGVGRGIATTAPNQIRFKLEMRTTPGDRIQKHVIAWRIRRDGYDVSSAQGKQRFRLDDH